MKLATRQIGKIKDMAVAYSDLSLEINQDRLTLKNPTHTITISNLDLQGIQSGVRGYLNVLGMLSTEGRRNGRLENGVLDDIEYVDINHIKSNPELRFECDFETISHIKTKNKNSKTLLQDSTQSYVFTGNHFEKVIETLSDSPVRYLKRTYPDIYGYLIGIESRKLAKLKEDGSIRD